MATYAQYQTELNNAKKIKESFRQEMNEGKKAQAKAKEAFQMAQNKLKEKEKTIEKKKKKPGKVDKDVSNSMQIDDIIDVIFASIERRRQLSADVQSNVSQPLSSRKHVILLRPSPQSMMEELEKIVNIKVNAKKEKEKDENLKVKRENKEHLGDFNDEDHLSLMIRAEQLMLLALHPAAPNPPLPAVPSQEGELKSWAEPGWHITLDVPCEHRKSILPLRSMSMPFQIAISECSSAPGRQSAALLKPKDMSHFMVPVPKYIDPLEPNIIQGKF